MGVPKSHVGVCALCGLGRLAGYTADVAVVVDSVAVVAVVAAVAVDLLCVEFVVGVLLVVFQWKVGSVEAWRRDCLVG